MFAAMAAAAMTAFALTAAAVSPDVVISQVYGGGGNSGATLQNDFIELVNRGPAPASTAGWSVQYASGAGPTWAKTDLPPLTLQPGQYLLVQQAAGTGGTTPLPAPDATGTIAMSATTGKVALVTNGTLLACSTADTCLTNPAVRDFVGYGETANVFEGAGPTPAPSNTTAVLRAANGCTETDSNAADFLAGAPNPRNGASPASSCGAIVNQPLAATCPANLGTLLGASASAQLSATDPDGVVASAAITSAPVTGIALGAFTPAGAIGGAGVTSLGVVAGAPVGSYSVQVRFANNDPTPQEATCTTLVTVANPAASARIRDIQGAGHISPLNGQAVTGVPGVVTAKRTNGFFMQDPSPDGDPATSEGLFVFTSSAPTANVADAVIVSGTVSEFRPGGADGLANLTITEIVSPTTLVLSTGNPLPAPTVIGNGGRVPPSQVIKAGNCGDIEPSACPFDANANGIDFYESLEGMLVQLNNPIATGPTSSFGEIPVIGDFGNNAGVRTSRGGVVVSAGEFNPERVFLDDGIIALPIVNVGDSFAQVVGVMDYSFGNFKLQVTAASAPAAGTLVPEITNPQGPAQLAIASFNVENLAATDPPAKFARLASQIVTNLQSPDILALIEIQDNDGSADSGNVDASRTFAALISAIVAAGGPAYQYRSINPENNQDGGQPGGNIRVGFLFNPARAGFVDRPGDTPTAATTVVNGPGGPRLSFSPGRIDPTNAAFTTSRKPLAGEFTFNGHRLFVIANHFNSKGGDQPLFGRFQPPQRSSEVQREQQATVVRDFVLAIRALDANAKIVVLGDLNDFEFSPALSIVKSAGLVDLVEQLAPGERYTYVFEGNSQVLDHILVTPSLATAVEYDVVHVNAEFADQASDHDPEVARLFLPSALIEVTAQTSLQISGLVYNRTTRRFAGSIRVTNIGGATIAAPLQVVLEGLTSGVVLTNAGGTQNGAPYVTGTAPLAAGQTVSVPVQFANPSSLPLDYAVKIYSGTF
jgi:hypothetical protein